MDFSFGNFQNRGPMPDLQVGSRLQVEVVKKERDNYVIRSVNGPGVFHGMIYLGHWVHEQQPAYSSNSMVNIYSNMCHPNFQMSKSVQREPLTVGQQPQHLVDLTNGGQREKQHFVVQQQQQQQRAPQMPPPTATDTLSIIKKNKRKNFIPCGIPSTATLNTGFMSSVDTRISVDGPTSSRQNVLANLSNGSSDLREISSFDKDFLRVCTDYVSRIKKVEVDMPSLLGGSGVFDTQQGKKTSVPQKQVPAKRKEVTFAPFQIAPNLPSGSGVRQNGSAFPVNPPVRNGSSASNALPRAAAGTANFVNVTPLNIMPGAQVVSTEKVKTLSNDERNAIQREAATAQSGAEELAILLGCEKLAAEARAASAAAAASKKVTEGRGGNSSQTRPAPVTGASSAIPVAGNSSAACASVPTNSCTTPVPGNSDLAPEPGTAVAVSLLPESPEVPTPDNENNETKEKTTANSPEKENAGKSRSEDSESPKPSSNDSRIVVKISLVNYTPSGASNASTASTAEAKPSPTPSTSSSSTKRSVADLRCPPEIARSFEEEQVVRRSDLIGCPPTMPRATTVPDEPAEGSDEEEKEKKPKKTAKKKHVQKAVKEEQRDEEDVVKETIDDTPQEQVMGMPGAPVIVPEKEENPQGLETGNVVWAKNGSEPYWPGQIFQFTRLEGVAGAVITWYGVDTFTPFVPLSKVDAFAEKYAQRFNPKRGDKKYQKGIARAIYQSKAPTESYRNNITKYIHEILVNLYHFNLGPFEITKKRKRKSAGQGLKKKKLALSALNDQADSQAGESSGLLEDEGHFDEDDYCSVEDSNGIPEEDLEVEPAGGSVSSEQHVTEPSSSSVSPHKSEDSGRTSPRSPIL